MAALVLVAPAIVALRLGRAERREQARAEAALAAADDEVGTARARASFAEFRSNTSGRLMCVPHATCCSALAQALRRPPNDINDSRCSHAMPVLIPQN